MDRNSNRCIRLIILVNGNAIEQRFPRTPLRNHLEGNTIPETQRRPDAERSCDDPALAVTIKELDLFYCADPARRGCDAMKFCRGRPPIETESVGIQGLSLEVLGRK